MLTTRLRIASARFSHTVGFMEHGFDEQAWHFQGWKPEQVLGDLPSGNGDPLIFSSKLMWFMAFEAATERTVGWVSLDRATADTYYAGGVVAPEFRQQGYGRELLTAVCQLAHQHFGVVHVLAGCETSNLASVRWLASCQFTPAAETREHVLPNGRVIESLWWQRTDPTARRRCRNLPS